MKQVTSWFKPKYLIILAIIAGIIFLLTKMKDFVKNAGSTNNEIPFETPNILIDEAKTNAIADIQQEAMSSLGTNEKVLFSSLEGLTVHELKDVFNKFGKRNYAYGMHMEGSLGLIGTKINLFQWYLKELNEKDLKKMRSIWKITGVSF